MKKSINLQLFLFKFNVINYKYYSNKEFSALRIDKRDSIFHNFL